MMLELNRADAPADLTSNWIGIDRDRRRRRHDALAVGRSEDQRGPDRRADRIGLQSGRSLPGGRSAAGRHERDTPLDRSPVRAEGEPQGATRRAAAYERA